MTTPNRPSASPHPGTGPAADAVASESSAVGPRALSSAWPNAHAHKRRSRFFPSSLTPTPSSRVHSKDNNQTTRTAYKSFLLLYEKYICDTHFSVHPVHPACFVFGFSRVSCALIGTCWWWSRRRDTAPTATTTTTTIRRERDCSFARNRTHGGGLRIASRKTLRARKEIASESFGVGVRCDCRYVQSERPSTSGDHPSGQRRWHRTRKSKSRLPVIKI